MELDTDKKIGKLLSAIIDVLDDMALEIEDLKDAQRELGDGLDAVSDDLEDVEDVVFGEDDEDDEDEDDYEYDVRMRTRLLRHHPAPPARRPSTSDESVLEGRPGDLPQLRARSWSSI